MGYKPTMGMKAASFVQNLGAEAPAQKAVSEFLRSFPLGRTFSKGNLLMLHLRKSNIRT